MVCIDHHRLRQYKDKSMAKDFRYRSLVDLAIGRSRESGHLPAYTFLHDGEDDSETIDYAELNRRARRVAAALDGCRPGDRAMLIVPPGLDFITAFLGCFYAGVIAVPAYPPGPARLSRSVARLRAIASSCGAKVVLTTQPILRLAEAMAAHAPELATLTWIAVDAEALPAQERGACDVDPNDVAFLQYTSGSTGAPKGVMVTHGNLLANLEGTYEACSRGEEADSVYVGWLPPYHDMGLVGQLLQPLYAGYPCVTMSPLHFLQRPWRWLRAMTKYRGTTSAAPNFAFDVCSRAIRAEERAQLDLSRWRMVVNGAEPIRAATLRTFAELFGPCGFRASAFFPTYGLAEATLMVSGGPRHQGFRTYDVDADGLEAGRALPAEPGRRSRTLVGVGTPLADHEVTIVDGAGRPVEPGTIGEIVLAGPSVTPGYWEDRRVRESRERGERGRLHSGDLGFLREDGELFVTGRSKDIVILRGRNLLPHDLEAAVEAAHPAIRRGCSAAFSVSVDDAEQLVIAAEVERRWGDPTAIVATIYRAVAEEFAVRPAEVLLLKAATIPKTSSGKLRRFQCRQGHRDGTLDVVHRG